jgi:hypothetical protein
VLSSAKSGQLVFQDRLIFVWLSGIATTAPLRLLSVH